MGDGIPPMHHSCMKAASQSDYELSEILKELRFITDQVITRCFPYYYFIFYYNRLTYVNTVESKLGLFVLWPPRPRHIVREGYIRTHDETDIFLFSAPHIPDKIDCIFTDDIFTQHFSLFISISLSS